MSQENVVVVRGLFAALDNQDWEAGPGLLATHTCPLFADLRAP